VLLGSLLLALGAVLREPAAPEPAGASATVTAPAVAETPAPAAVLPALPEASPSAVEVWTGPPPPTLSTDREARTDQLLQLRKQRRTDGMNQLNERQAARRARLGLAPQ
jgi:hypothetical protein